MSRQNFCLMLVAITIVFGTIAFGVVLLFGVPKATEVASPDQTIYQPTTTTAPATWPTTAEYD